MNVGSERPSATAVSPSVCAREIIHVELYVANAVQTVHFLSSVLSLPPVLYAGPETGMPDRVSYLLQHRGIRLLITSPLGTSGPIADLVREHGDTVGDIAFRVDHSKDAFETALATGARPALSPSSRPSIAAFGATVHSLVDSDGRQIFDRFRPVETRLGARTSGVDLLALDHVAISVEAGGLDPLIRFYEKVFGFHESQEEIVATEYSGMNSKVAESGEGAIKLPIVEPVDGVRRSPIQEYLSFHGGPGVHHLAFLTDDIINTVRRMEAAGMCFMPTPASYYEVLEDRVGPLPVPLEALRETNVLVDRDQDGYLLQVFTKPIHTRPTLSLEIIQRERATGFGGGNVKALFEAIEREQARRQH